MPDVSGIEAAEAVRAKEKATGAHIPIIALTAYAMKGDEARSLEAGCDGYIAKPLDTRALPALIAHYLTRPRTGGGAP